MFHQVGETMKAVFYWLALTATVTNLAAADRLVDYVSPSLLKDSPAATNSVAHHATTNIPTVAVRPRPVSAVDRWERFEAEFGIKQRNNSVMLDSLQTAKYQLDKTTFVMQEWIYSIEDTLSFDYGLNDLGLPAAKPYRPASSTGFVDTLLSARLKSDINLNLVGASFVGVKLVLPLGN